MKLTILGNCGGVPDKNNACSSFLIQTEQTNVLFDCGAGTLDKLSEYIKIDALDAVVISHFHPDHYSDLLCLKKSFDLCSDLFGWKPLTIYCPKPTKAINQLIFSPYIHYEFYDRETPNLNLQDLSLNFIQTEHDNLTPSYMWSIEENESKARITFTGDIANFNEETINFISGSDALIADSYVPEEYQDDSCKHLSPTKAISLAEKAKVPMLILTHFNPFIPFSEYVSEMENAKPKIPTYVGKPKENFYF